jgi:hypothetical protein
VTDEKQLLDSVDQVLGDSIELDRSPCPSFTSAVSNDDETMDSPPPAQETEHYAGPTMSELSALEFPRIKPGEEVCFGMVSNSNVFNHERSDFKIGLKYPCPFG